MITNSYGFEYIQLVRKSDMKEVYSSLAYKREDNEAYDFEHIVKNLNYYFDRVNSGIQQQLESPKTTPEVKSTLKLLQKSDYLVRSTRCMEPGIGFKPINWTKEADEFLK